MERIKANKPNHLFQKNHSEYQFTAKTNAPHLQSNNHAFLLKYASSIIQVVPEERLDSSSNHLGSKEHTNGEIEQSLIYGLQSRHMLAVNRTKSTQNTCPPVTLMKRKVGNRKILAYNFSNLTILNEKIKLLFKKRSKEMFELIRNRTALSMDCYHLKSKKQMKRGSDCSGYTASTSNDEIPSKKQSKKLTENILKELKKDGGNQLKGFLEFKFMMNLSNAFKCLTQYSSRPFIISQVSTIKCQPVEHYQTADHSIEITRQLPNNVSKSLAYDADLRFQFTQKEVKTSNQMGSKMTKKNISFEESIVENYKPCELHICSPKRLPLSKNIANPRSNKPISFVAPEKSREVWTNVYELPLLSEKELQCGKQKKTQFYSLLEDHFTRNDPQVIIPVIGIMNDFEQFKTQAHRKIIKSPENKMEKHRIFNKVNQQIEKIQSPMQRSTVKNEPVHYKSPENTYKKQKTPTIIINQPNIKVLTTNRVNIKEEAHAYNPQNIYQINYNLPKRIIKQPKNEQKISKYPQDRVLHAANSPNKPCVSNLAMNGGKQQILQREPARNDFVSKRSFYSPQAGKGYSPIPQRKIHPLQVTPNPIHPLPIHQQPPRSHIQAEGRATSFTNNYYFTGSQAMRPSSKINEPSLNLFHENIHRNSAAQLGYARQSTQRVNIFFNQSPMISQLQQRQRSNRFQRMRSNLSRPKSMNEKIFITLRKEK